MDDCDACKVQGVEPVPRWKAPLLFVGVLFFCPCHLPVTFGVLAAGLGGIVGLGWLAGQKTLVFAIFSLVYIVLMVVFVRWVLRRRSDERIHEAHAQDA